MTVQSDLKKAIATAESMKGSYATFAESTEDTSAKQLFQELSTEMQRQVDSLSSRLRYLEKNNPLCQQNKESN